MKIKSLSAFVAFSVFAGVQARADNMASIAIAPATGVVTLTPRWAIGGSLAGFHLMAQDLSLGGGANQFHSIKGTAIPSGGDISAFTLYIAASGAATPHADIGSKLTPNSYSALTSADPDVGYGAVDFYFIHHKATGDYFTVIKPSSGTASAVTDLKPMNGPGGPATGSVPGYFGLTFAASDLGYGANLFYYFRTDPVTGFTKFGTLIPALLGTSADKFDLGVSGHNALDFTGTDVGFGTNKMYYARLDPVTGFTIFGTLDPLSGRASDIANLGSVYSTLDFVPGDVGFGTNKFYATGAVNPTWQSVSFAAIADRAIGAGSFTVAPSASSALAIALTVVPGSVGSATISAPVGGVFTVTPTAPGLITLQATQAGQSAPIAYELNMLRQSFTASGAGSTPAITNSSLTAPATAGAPFSYTITASGSPTSYAASPLPAGLAIVAATGVIAGTPTTAGTTIVTLTATNASGTGNSATLTITVGASNAAPIITSPTTVSGAAGTPFNPYTIAATGLPTSYSATGLPPGLTLDALTGAITGTPTAGGSYLVTIAATNANGTTTATVTIVIAGDAAASSRIVNFSARAMSGSGSDTLIMGFVVSGNGKSFLVRGIGPTLASYGISSPLADPLLTLFDANGVMATNDDWQTTMSGQPDGSLIAPTAARVGAFALPNGSKDSTLLLPVNNGAHTAGLFRPNGTSGVALTEIYDTDGSNPGSRLVNVSARMNVTAGEGTLIAGLVIAGNAPKTLLIRGVGPALSAFAVTGVLADPQITVFSGNTQIAGNDDWGTGTSTAAQIAGTSAQVGAFALPAGSKDAALLIALQPGTYTVQVTGVGNTAGVALIEIYDTQ